MPYVIDLKAKHDEKETFAYHIDDTFFSSLEVSLINHGNLEALVTLLTKDEGRYQVEIVVKGHVAVACDRCLADVDVAVDSTYVADVEFGAEPETGDGYIVLAENETALDLVGPIYDTVVLALPIHPVHADGECDSEMLGRLGEYLVADAGLEK